MTQSTQPTTEIATIAGGCFWCLETIYNDLQGVESAISGYMGGMVKNPSYQAVCSGTTGHAEVVQIKFDPSVITLAEIYEIFYTMHDPTTLNRQGNDVGTQYRSAIFYHDDGQRESAEKVTNTISNANLWPNPIVTEITEATTFYPAEDYHQNYFANNPNQGYCRVVVAPKVSKFRKKYTDRLKSAA